MHAPIPNLGPLDKAVRPEAVPADAGAITRLRVLMALASLPVLCLWIAPMGSSLWLDELTTFWSVYKGVLPSIARSQFWPGQNTAYTVLVAAIVHLMGTSEIVLRLPSLFAVLLAAWLLFRLGECLFDRETGILAVVVFTSLHPVAKEAATNARPYGIALFFVVGSMLQLVRWLDTQRLRNMAGFIVTCAAIPYFHLLFTTTYLIFCAYGIYVWRAERRIRIKQLVLAAAAVMFLLTPLLWYVLFISRPSAESSWAGTPDFQILLSSFIPNILAATLLLGGISAFFVYRRTGAAFQISRSTAFLLGSWLILPVITTFVVARATPLKVFVPRYYLPAFVALALIVGYGIRMLSPARLRLLMAGFVVGGSIVSYAGYHLTVSPHREDWRTAAKVVRSKIVSPTTPVLLRVGLIETQKIRWDPIIDRDSPLLCPLSKYPMPGQIVLLPYRVDAGTIQYMQQISSQILATNETFLLVSRKDEEFIAWMRGWFLGQGFESSEVGRDQGVTVLLYHRVSHQR
jgi:hypothetical protein